MKFPIVQQGQGLHLKQSVDARELYQALGLDKSQWSRWHKQNIAENPFAVTGLDYEGFDMMSSGNWTQNYLLSIDFAKKLAMQVKTDKGEQIRNYFLECERKSQSPVMPALPQSFSEALLLAGTLQQQIEQDAPKVAMYDTIVERENLMTITQVASKLGMSAQALNKRLVTLGAYDARIKRCKTFTSEFITKGYGKMKVGSTGHDQGLITQEGQAWIVGLFGGAE